MAKQVMLGVRLDAETRSAFKAWCAARQVTAQAVLRDDVARHLSTPAVPSIPRDRALVLMPEDLAQAPVGAADWPGRQGASAASPWDELWEGPSPARVGPRGVKKTKSEKKKGKNKKYKIKRNQIRK
jgi:hypothetical protein